MAADRTRALFETYERAISTNDVEALIALYADAFLFDGGQGMQVIPKAALRSALPKRQELFAASGLQETRLVELEETVLDRQHVVVKVMWRMQYARADAPPLADDAYATYLCADDGSALRILMQVDHQDLLTRVQELGLR